MLKAKNSANLSKYSKILIGLAAFLTFSYFLSFTKSCSSQDKREKIRTALVNQKYRESISSFELVDAGASLTINKRGNFWAIRDKEGKAIIPASSERLDSLTENLITVRNLYKISDKIGQNSTFGLTNGTEFHLRYYTENTFHELVFGNQDFSLSSRYLMTEKSTQVYEIDSSLDSYLSTSIQNWAEPFIISQQVLGKINPEDIQRAQVIDYESNHLSSISDLQKLLDLRHGGIPDDQELSSLLSLITLELGNKNEIELEIYESSKENEFIVLTNYKTQKEAQPVFTSKSKISSWTYNKIKEITL